MEGLMTRAMHASQGMTRRKLGRLLGFGSDSLQRGRLAGPLKHSIVAQFATLRLQCDPSEHAPQAQPPNGVEPLQKDDVLLLARSCNQSGVTPPQDLECKERACSRLVEGLMFQRVLLLLHGLGSSRDKQASC
eukprot:1781533-Amphidinium_carterae.1